MKNTISSLLPLVITVSVLTWLSTLMAGRFAIPYWGEERMLFVADMLIRFIFMLCAIFAAVVLIRTHHYVDRLTGQLDIKGLWNSLNMSLATSGMAFTVAVYGMTAASNLAELYRTSTSVWHDELLWSIERPIFDLLLSSPLNIPWLWDEIYVLFWTSMILGLALLVIHGKMDRYLAVLMALVIAYFLTRSTALAFPTAGPAFYHPELFHLQGTQSQVWQDELRLYMTGQIGQPGYYPGTMAMPSLHVGMAGMLVWALGKEWRSSLWISVPGFFLAWISTVMLGWHYILDGIGGVAVAGLSCAVASILTRFLRIWMPGWKNTPS